VVGVFSFFFFFLRGVFWGLGCGGVDVFFYLGGGMFLGVFVLGRFLFLWCGLMTYCQPETLWDERVGEN